MFAKSGSTKQFTIQIVANKYNPANYWQVVSAFHVLCLIDMVHVRSGRWRSQYDIDMEGKTVVGKVLVNVHYYEQGNVSLQIQQVGMN